MSATAFHRGSNGQQTLLVSADGDDISHLRFANSQGAGLVERDGGKHAEIFQVRTTLDQYAATRGTRDAGEHRRRGGNSQRTGRGGHQHRHCTVKRFGEGVA